MAAVEDALDVVAATIQAEVDHAGAEGVAIAARLVKSVTTVLDHRTDCKPRQRAAVAALVANALYDYSDRLS